MTLSQLAYFYVDHDNKRNIVYSRKGAALDLSSISQMIVKDRCNQFEKTTFVELGSDVERASDDVIYTESCKQNNRLRFYEENQEKIYFLRFSSHGKVFLMWEFTKGPFTLGVVRIKFPRAYELSITPVQCARLKIQQDRLMDSFIADS